MFNHKLFAWKFESSVDMIRSSKPITETSNQMIKLLINVKKMQQPDYLSFSTQLLALQFLLK